MLSGIWLRNPSVGHVYGARGIVAVIEVPSLTVRRADEPDPLPFHSLFGVGDRLVAVGGNLDSSGPALLGIARPRRLTPEE